jgi:hypothetical protein
MAGGEPVPPGIDVTRPNIARVYDAFLDGKDNFAADRAVVDLTLRIVPDAAAGAKANRAFLRRVVRYLAGQAGIGQFLDIGSGLPSQGNVHEVAHEVSPGARVAYIDSDPVVLLHAEALLGGAPAVRVVTADVRAHRLRPPRRPADARHLAPHPRRGGPGGHRGPVPGGGRAGKLPGHLQLPHARARAPAGRGDDT